MKCPLLCIFPIAKGTEDEKLEQECLKEDCAWWADSEEGCVMICLEQDLAGICLSLKEISEEIHKDLPL